MTEGNAARRNFVFTVTRFLPSGNEPRSSIRPATAPRRRVRTTPAASGTLTFTGAETSQTITILVNGDTTDEDDENVLPAV